jgi:uncharacterized protein (UPF0548 family)
VLVHPGRLSDERLAALAESARDLPLSYPHVGVTREGRTPEGYRSERCSVDLGAGDAVFARAVEGLRTWQAHRQAGARVAPADAPVRTGQSIVVAVPLVAATVVAPCRIVHVDDGPGRVGFAYGTLVGHPERGEESFVVQRDGDRSTFVITICARPAHPVARLGGPVTRRVQLAATRRYLAGLQDFVGGDASA